jgi:class 3 adenylate cyclase
MFTDIVGYSAMMQKNEARTLKLLEEHRELLRPIFLKYGGREVETIGDAFFVEFASALQAFLCACEIQNLLHERNISVPADGKFDFVLVYMWETWCMWGNICMETRSI